MKFGTESLVEAVKAYRAALELSIRERVPLDWAMTQNNLGEALAIFGKRGFGIEFLREAVKAFQAALSIFDVGQLSYYSDIAKQNLSLAKQILTQQEREH